MTKITLKIDGMMCEMCEAHVNDAVRNELGAKNVTSSHSKKETVIISENDIEDDKLCAVVETAGYQLVEINREPYEKKGLFAKLLGK